MAVEYEIKNRDCLSYSGNMTLNERSVLGMLSLHKRFLDVQHGIHSDLELIMDSNEILYGITKIIDTFGGELEER